MSDWITFSVLERGHLITGEYRLDRGLVFVRDQRGGVKAKISDGDPVIEDASLLLRQLAYGQ
jgi:hypothetical protein